MEADLSEQFPPCTVGNILGTECHRNTYCRQVGLHNLSDITDINLLKERSGINFLDNNGTLCYHHEKVFISRYEQLQKFCCDPFKIHKKQIAVSLRRIDDNVAKLLKIPLGKKVCSRCQQKASEYVTERSNKSQMDVEHFTDEFSPQYQLGASCLNEIIPKLGLSPVKYVKGKGKGAYLKRKLGQVNVSVKKKLETTLNASFNEPSTSSAKQNLCQKCEDLNLLVDNLKEKFHKCSRAEKIKILTLVPHSWSIDRTVTEFKTTHYMVKLAKKRKKEDGILPDIHPKRGPSLSSDTINAVFAFYEDNDSSRIAAGMKACTVMSVEGEKVVKPKRLLLINVRELYIQFKENHPDIKIGFSKFCELRPPWCLTAGTKGIHSVCVCEMHQNVKFLVDALQNKDNYKKLLSIYVCDIENRKCMLHSCSNCPGVTALRKYLDDIFHDFDESDTILYKQWVQTDRKTIIQAEASVADFCEVLLDKIDKLATHHYIAKSQTKYLRSLKENLPSKNVIILLDFSENFSFLVQDSVQGYHWNNSQCTLHPFVAYYKNSDGELLTKSICVISDDLQHDVSAVYTFQTHIVNYLKTLLSGDIKNALYFSDGCAGQYKNFANLCHHKEDFGFSAEWHFFATSHGKSPCDGIGGIVKRLVARASLQAHLKNHILSASDMYNWCVKNINGIQFFYITKEECAITRKNLESRFANYTTLAGTRAYHCFVPENLTTINISRISSDLNKIPATFTSNAVALPMEHFQCQPGDYVASVYDDEWFVGNIEEICEDTYDCLIRFMHHAVNKSILYWPSREDKCHIPYEHILCKVSPPSVQGRSARNYVLDSKDFSKIMKLYHDFKTSLQV